MPLKITQRVQPIHAGQTDVEQYQIGRVAAGQVEPIFGAAGGAGPVAGLIQVKCETAPHQVVVIYQQDVFAHNH